jgi:hypothetical protein
VPSTTHQGSEQAATDAAPRELEPLKQSSWSMASEYLTAWRCRPGNATAFAMLLSIRQLESKVSREALRGVQWRIPARDFGKALARSSKATKHPDHLSMRKYH